MRLKSVLVVAGLAFALSHSFAVQGAGIGRAAGSNGNGGNGGGNPNPTAVDVAGLGIDCPLEDLLLLAKFDLNKDAEGGLKASGPYADWFTIQVNDDSQSGTWVLNTDLDGYELKAWAAKGGTGWEGALTHGETSGKWWTEGIEVGRNGDTPDMSNLTFWGCKKSVPEPGSILAGIAALGMLALGRKRLA